MTDIVNGKGPRDVFVGLIAKAISTGAKRDQRERGSRDKEYFRGRVTGFVYAAAMLADQMYGVDIQEARHRIAMAVREARDNLPLEDLRDAARVGNLATDIATKVLLEG